MIFVIYVNKLLSYSFKYNLLSASGLFEDLYFVGGVKVPLIAFNLA